MRMRNERDNLANTSRSIFGDKWLAMKRRPTIGGRATGLTARDKNLGRTCDNRIYVRLAESQSFTVVTTGVVGESEVGWLCTGVGGDRVLEVGCKTFAERSRPQLLLLYAVSICHDGSLILESQIIGRYCVQY